MYLESLRVIHLSKRRADFELLRTSVEPALTEAFAFDSCQRKLWILHDDFLDARQSLPEGVDSFSGEAAYLFLMRVTTGLESEVLGETDVFGQFKDAWRKSGGEKGELHFWMQRLFEDTKEVRTQHLQNIGGSSYGGLVRKLIREKYSEVTGPLLLIGAGQIAQSVSPQFLPHLIGNRELWIWNRNGENLNSLKQDLSKNVKDPTLIRALQTEGDLENAWKTAAHVVVCIPAGSARDARWIEWRKSTPGSVVHLGGMQKDCAAWQVIPDFYALDDVFRLEKSQSEIRTAQVARAVKACEERAKLRGLSPSISVPHGWEDLAVFA